MFCDWMPYQQLIFNQFKRKLFYRKKGHDDGPSVLSTYILESIRKYQKSSSTNLLVKNKEQKWS